MNRTVHERATSYVRRLRVGDRFVEDGITWEVTRLPESIAGEGVWVYLKPWPTAPRSRSREFFYPDSDHRVTLSHNA